MHNFTSFITDDEVTGLVEEYAIPLDLYPRAMSLVLTMNNLSVSAIVVASMSGFLKFPMAQGVQIGRGTVLRPNKVIVQNTTPPLPASTLILAKSDFQRVVERGYERILVAKEKKKSQEGQNKAAGKRPGHVRAPVCTKKRKTTPLSMTTSSILNDAKQRRDMTIKKVNDQLKGNLECLTVDLSQAKVFRHNYIRQLLPTVVQQLLASEEYKKSLLEPFNQAIITGWSEGVLVDRTEEKAQAILTTADDYDPECHAKFKSAFDRLFVKSYPYVEKLVASFHSRWAIYKTCDQRVKVKPWVAEPSMSRESFQEHCKGDALDPWILALEQGGARLKISTFYLYIDILFIPLVIIK
ncbi:hypothetical protein Tco_0353033 [Tanacetum coccineum]